jgi:hypothetical protein
MRLTILIENNELDLFEDEIVELNSSIANTEDITKINTEYTKSFTVPASTRNNKIFKHYYNADIDNTFDSRTKKDASIFLDGFLFKSGKIRLDKVSVKKQKPSSYTIIFWGSLVAVKNKVKEDKLSDLDLSYLDFTPTIENITEGIQTGVTNFEEVIFTTITSETLTFNSSNVLYIDADKLFPAIKLFSIIEAIESKYAFNFSREFFPRPEFFNLYMVLNNQNDGLNNLSFTFPIFDTSIPSTRRRIIGFTFIPSDINLEYTLEVFRNNESFYKYYGKGNKSAIYEKVNGLDEIINENDTYSFVVSSLNLIGFEVRLTNLYYQKTGLVWNLLNSSPATYFFTNLDYKFEIKRNIPEIKVIDFLKNIFQMFKLVVIPQDDGKLYVNDINSYYNAGKVIDITDYVDVESFEVSRPEIFNPINFKYEEPTTLLAKKFKQNTGASYGDESLTLADENGEPLEGQELEVKIGFEQMFFERLKKFNQTDLSRVVYGLMLDDKLEKVKTKPIIFYRNIISTFTYDSIVVRKGTTTANNTVTRINVPSPCFDYESAESACLNWGLEYSPYDGVALTNTLYQKYWSKYLTSIFNIKRRNYKFKAFLPAFLLNKIELNDVLFIKDRYYRINDFTANLLDGETSLNLINTFETNLGIFAPSQNQIITNHSGKVIPIYITSKTPAFSALKIDLGFDTSWLTAVQNNTFLDVSFTQNNDTTPREMALEVTNTLNETFTIYINQKNNQ